MTKIEEILCKYLHHNHRNELDVKDGERFAMKEYAEYYAKCCLEIAAENVELLKNNRSIKDDLWPAYDHCKIDISYSINKDSILNIKLPDHE